MDDFEKILQESKKNNEFAELRENSKIEYEVMKKIVTEKDWKNIKDWVFGGDGELLCAPLPFLFAGRRT